MNSLNPFSQWGGLSINYLKNTKYLSNCSLVVVTWFQDTYDIQRGELPVDFLWVPLISSNLCINDCMPFIQKITNRLEFCTIIFLSLVGRAQLITTILFAI